MSAQAAAAACAARFTCVFSLKHDAGDLCDKVSNHLVARFLQASSVTFAAADNHAVAYFSL